MSKVITRNQLTLRNQDGSEIDVRIEGKDDGTHDFLVNRNLVFTAKNTKFLRHFSWLLSKHLKWFDIDFKENG